MIVLGQTDSVTRKLMKDVTTSWITEQAFERNQSYLPLDTTGNRDELFLPLYARYGLFQDLGNIGTPGQSLIFTFNRAVDFSFIQNPYEGYFFKPESCRYYNTKTPYTDFVYATGKGELLYLKARHAQNITPRWNAGVDYFGFSSLGNYPMQYTSPYHTQIFSSYRSKKGKYAVLANLTWNLGSHDESGGLQSDSAYEALSGSNKTGSVRLAQSTNAFRNRAAYLKQYFYYGKSETRILGYDTSDQFTAYGYFSHTLKAEEFALYLTNKGDTNFFIYPGRYFDSSNVSLDSSTHSAITNRIAYSLYHSSAGRDLRFLELAATHKYIHIYQRGQLNFYNNIMLEGTMERSASSDNSVSFRLYGAYAPAGYNQNDTRLEAEAGYTAKWFYLSGGIFNHLLEPDYTLAHYHTNYFKWDNSFSKINVSNWHLALQTKKFRHNFHINYNQYVLANWVYMDTDARSRQSNAVALLTSASVEKTFQLWKFFFENKIIYQKSTQDYLRLPELGAILRYYFATAVFRKAVKMQLGINVFYNSAFYASNYNPATHAFYLQNSRSIGNYPLVNAFISGEIVKAVLFASYTHLNQDWWNNTGYYSTPGYPIPLTSFNYGIRWRMYN